MITIILFAILGLIFVIKSVWIDLAPHDLEETIGNALATILGIFVGAVIGFLVALALPMDTKQKTDTYNIVSLQDNNSTNGNFFLGIGSFDGKMNYVFYYKENNTYKMKQIEHENAVIKHSNDPKIRRYRPVPTDALINYFALDDYDSEKFMRYVIYVPKGTIKSNYTLNAK